MSQTLTDSVSVFIGLVVAVDDTSVVPTAAGEGVADDSVEVASTVAAEMLATLPLLQQLLLLAWLPFFCFCFCCLYRCRIQK